MKLKAIQFRGRTSFDITMLHSLGSIRASYFHWVIKGCSSRCRCDGEVYGDVNRRKHCFESRKGKTDKNNQWVRWWSAARHHAFLPASEMFTGNWTKILYPYAIIFAEITDKLTYAESNSSAVPGWRHHLPAASFLVITFSNKQQTEKFLQAFFGFSGFRTNFAYQGWWFTRPTDIREMHRKTVNMEL